jgi:broad specificity phosphatase PhoE
MGNIVYLIRHAESEANATGDLTLRDPILTEKGRSQASNLAAIFPDPHQLAVILTSPLSRAIETTLGAFSRILDKRDIGDTGVEDGARLLVEAKLQERSTYPADTGSEKNTLQDRFPHLNLSCLDKEWYVKEGLNAPDDQSVKQRAQLVRDRLLAITEQQLQITGQESVQRNIGIISHSSFMQFLADDFQLQLPQTGWKAFTIGRGKDGLAALTPAKS